MSTSAKAERNGQRTDRSKDTSIGRERAATKRTSPKRPGLHGATRFRSLIVPIDLTPSADRVLGRLSLLPLAEDARVTLLHVVPGSLPSGEQRSAARDALKTLTGEAQHLRKSLPKNVTVEPLVKIGAAAKEIGAWAAKMKADLIVMGRGGGRALRDTFLGSTAERVIRRAQLPVLVVRLSPRAAYSRPALALDLDETAHEVVRLMLLVLSRQRPRVWVIHAVDVAYERWIYSSLSQDEAEARKDELQLQATQELARLLTSALVKAKEPPEDAPSWKIDVRYGRPRRVIRKAIKKSKPDLLVLGTHGYSRAVHLFLGTVAGDLLREVKCDVLVVPPVRSRE